MATLTTRTPSLADLLNRLGDVPPSRVLMRPAPGQATEVDVITLNDREGRLCELVDGVLVEKAMGYCESVLAMILGRLLLNFIVPRNLGLVTGADGMVRLFPGLVRIPDVAFASWDRVPGRAVPKESIPDLVPDLAIEVLSQSNTGREMVRKVGEYFEAGVRLVWLVDPKTRTVAVHAPATGPIILDLSATLDGGAVLPGFALPLTDLFAELDRHG